MQMTILRKTLLSVIVGVVFFTGCEEDPLNPTVDPQAQACFTISADNGIVGDEFAFTNCSENATKYAWDFGDGNKSTQREPKHSYSEAGTFEVTLLAGEDKNQDGVLDEKDDAVSVSRSITVKHLPLACFSVSSDNGKVGSEFVFTNCSEHATAYSWDFGDGNSSDVQEPTHIYEEAGTYEVTLYAGEDTNADGVINADDNADSYSTTITVNALEVTLEIGIRDATTWTSENSDLAMLEGATIDLYFNTSSIGVDEPDYTVVTDEYGNAPFYELPAGQYYIVVTKDDLSNIVNGLRVAGVFQSQAEIDSAPHHPNDPVPGDLMFTDMNGDGVIDSKDEVPYGQVQVMGDMSIYYEVIIGN